MMNRIFVYFLFLLLVSCGFSEGDNVVIVPDDSPSRTSPWHGVFEKADGEQAIINKGGKFITVPLNEVFSSEDEVANQIARSRKDFFEIFFKNGDVLNQDSIRSVLIGKAKKGNLNDWVAFLELQPDIFTFNKLVVKSETSTDDMIDAWNDVFDSFSDLEEEVSHLTNPIGSPGNGNFSVYIQSEMKLSVMDAITRTYTNIDSSNLDIWKKSIKTAFKLVPLRVKEAQQQSLLIGKKLSDTDIESVRIATMNKIVSDTLNTSILFASKEDGSSVKLAKFLKNELNYPEEALIAFHGKKTWDDFLAAAKIVDEWSAGFTADDWLGKVKFRGSFIYVDNDVDLAIFFKDSLLHLNAKLAQSNGETLKGTVSQTETGIQIKDENGNWDWLGNIDKDGALVLSGKYPVNYSIYEVNLKLRGAEEINKLAKEKLLKDKQLQEERTKKIAQIEAILKAEKWYGVPFNENKTIFQKVGHWIPAAVLITLDFDQLKFMMRDIGKGSEKEAQTVFSFNVNEFGKGELSAVPDQESRTQNWYSGDDWEINFDPNTQTLAARVPSKPFNPGLKIEFLPEQKYLKRLESLKYLGQSQWRIGDITDKGASPGRWYSTLFLTQANILSRVVKLDGIYASHNRKTKVNYIAIPVAERGVVLSVLNKGGPSSRVSYSTAFSEDFTKDDAVFRDWQHGLGYIKVKGAKGTQEIKKTPVQKVNVEKGQIKKTSVKPSQNGVIEQPAQQQSSRQAKETNSEAANFTRPEHNDASQAADGLLGLLNLAKMQMSKNHLTSPQDDNAFATYQMVLRVSPDNVVAKKGINKITKKYISWGYHALKKREFKKANSYLNKAKHVSPAHPAVHELELAIDKAHQQQSPKQQLPKEKVAVDNAQEQAVAPPPVAGEQNDTNQDKQTKKPSAGEQFQRDLQLLGKTLGGLFR